jgi:hypothetical protein
MNVVEIPVRNIKLQYPSEWDEINRSQAIKIGRLLYYLFKGVIDADQFRKLVVDLFINRVNNMARKLSNAQELDLWGNEWLLAETVNFFFDIKKDEKTGKDVYEVVPRFVKNLVPWFRMGILRTKYVGPGDFFNGMVFAEFKDALACADKFMQTSDEVWLDRITAILYRRQPAFLWYKRRKSDWDGKERIPYNPSLNERNARKMKRAPMGVKFMAFLYVMGCLYMLRTDADGLGIEIDGQQCSFSLLFKNTGGNKGGADGLGMTGVMMAIAESGVFGNIHDTAKSDVWDVLTRIYQLEIQRRELDAEMNKKK